MNEDIEELLIEEELTPEQIAELEESSRAASANPHDGEDWPTVKARLLAQINAQEREA